MSLNGLDDEKIKEAHEAAVAEPGGWFLLNYTSRDEVVLLSRGNGGIVEIRNNISQYEETSPLYGFLRYRRRNVIIKYMPDGCSRLVQARAHVHFNAICDRFAPCDTTFDITTSKELKDTTLSAACSLHTASGSTSSSTSSLRRRRLMEIAEEEEEEQRDAKRQSTVKEEDQQDDTEVKKFSRPTTPTLDPPVTLDSKLASSPEASHFAGTTDPPSFVGMPRPPSPAKSLDVEGPRRMSSQSSRDYYSYSSYSYGKPRIKLGPRPSVDAAGRPRTPGSGGAASRLISSIPTNLRLKERGKRSNSQGRASEDSQFHNHEEPSSTAFLSSTVPIPENASLLEPSRPFTSGLGDSGRPSTSSGVSVKSMPSYVPPSKHHTMTPEKIRLMKAMQLRQKKKRQSEAAPPVPTVGIQAVPSLPSQEPKTAAAEAGPDKAETRDASEPITGNQADLPADQSSVKADSGIDVASSIHHDYVSVDTQTDTQTDSHPASPVCASSEVGDSTKASSFSESTDETPRAPEHKSEHQDGEAIEVADGEHEETPTVEAKSPVEPAAKDAASSEEVESNKSERRSESTSPDTRTKLETQVEGIQEKSLETTADPQDEEGIKPQQIIPISKFAANPQEKESVVETEDPQNAEHGPRNIDEVESHPVETAKKTQDGSAASPPKWKLPISKYSTQDPKSPTSSTIPSIVTTAGDDINRKDLNATPTGDSMEAESAPGDSKRSKRPEPIKTDHDLPDKDNLSDDEGLTGELQSATFQDAKSMTASKSPVSVSSPGLQGAPATPRVVRTVSSPVRGSLSTPADSSSGPTRTVSSGAAFMHKIPQQQLASHLAPKPPGRVGSSISQRIKAFEQMSGKSSSPMSSAPKERPSSRPSSTFFAVRKASIREPPRSPSVVDRANSVTRGSMSPPERRDEPSEGPPFPSRERSGSVASRLSVFEGGNVPRGRPESIQVTARIVREPGQMFPKAPDAHGDPSDLSSFEFKQSPLIIDHQKAASTADSSLSAAARPISSLEPAAQITAQEPRKSIQERRLSKDNKRQSQSGEMVDGQGSGEHRPRRRSSLTIVKDFIKDRRDSLVGKSPSTDNLGNLMSPALPTGGSLSPSRPPSTHQNGILSGRMSISSRRSSISPDNMNTPTSPIKPLSPTSTGDLSGSGDEKRNGSSSSLKEGKNRASRFMRRLSSSLSAGRNKAAPAISATVAEESITEVEAAAVAQSSLGQNAAAAATTVASMGDVNVQFPDNLLWKRRSMSLDSRGFLILSATRGGTSITSTREKQVRRYHLSEFKTPYAPEIEVQELPNSVCLDFVDGSGPSGIQVACEDRTGQLNVLHILVDAHQSHSSFGQ